MEGGIASEGRGALDPHQSVPADLSRSKPCARPFLISNIMGLEENSREEDSREEVGREEEQEEDVVGVSPGVSPGPDSDGDLNGTDEDSIAKVSYSNFEYNSKKKTCLLIFLLTSQAYITLLIELLIC